jgi:hypothetical protein
VVYHGSVDPSASVSGLPAVAITTEVAEAARNSRRFMMRDLPEEDLPPAM